MLNKIKALIETHLKQIAVLLNSIDSPFVTIAQHDTLLQVEQAFRECLFNMQFSGANGESFEKERLTEYRAAIFYYFVVGKEIKDAAIVYRAMMTMDFDEVSSSADQLTEGLNEVIQEYQKLV